MAGYNPWVRAVAKPFRSRRFSEFIGAMYALMAPVQKREVVWLKDVHRRIGSFRGLLPIGGSPFRLLRQGARLTLESLESRCVMTTTLGLGDIAFTGYQSSLPDRISIVLLKDVTAGTVITLTDNAWTSASGALQSNEGNSVLTFGGSFAAGTQLNYDATRSSNSRWANGLLTTNLSDVTSNGFSLANGGDNLFVYNGSTPPTTASGADWIAAFATKSFLSTGTTSSNTTYLPSAFTNGNTAITLGLTGGAGDENGVYTAGSFAGTAAAIRTQVHNVGNWSSFTTAGGLAVPPSAVFTVNNNTNTAPTIAVNLGITVRTNSTGNVISAAALLANDSEQTASQLVYRITSLPAAGTLRFNSIAIVANVTTFTQADITAGRLTYDGPSASGGLSFGFSVSDGSFSVASSFAVRVIPNVLLNELKVNPPGNQESGKRYQYIELRGTPNLLLTNMVVAMLDGNSSDMGRANYVLPLTGRSLGSNGLLIIKSPTSGHSVAPATAVVADPLFDSTVGGVLSRQTVSFYLGSSTTGLVVGTDLDANNDGTLELLPSDFVLLDNVGWSDGGAGDRVYGGVALTQSSGTPDAATRFNSNNSSNVSAWFNGDLLAVSSNPREVLYDAARGSGNLPINPVVAVVTPGEVNYTAPPVVTTNTGLSVLVGTIGNAISGIHLASTDVEYSGSSLVYRVTALPASGSLRLNGVNVVANSTTFNQLDIDAGRLTIDAGASASETSFAFSVSNGIASNVGTFLLGYRAVTRTNLRIANYNIASSGGNGAPRTGLGTILEAIGSEIVSGIARRIDVLALQEVLSQVATTQLVAGLLNSAYGTTTYVSGTLNGGTAGNGTLGVVYNNSTVQLVSETAIGTSSSGSPRQSIRYRFRPVGTTGAEDFYMYNSHLKAENNSTDAQNRFLQAQTIRNNADALGNGVNVIYTGDLNVYRSSEAAYQEFLSAGNGQGRDPINRPGDWNNNASFVGIHTQAPSATPQGGLIGGGLDDRFDFQLLTASFFDGVGLEYSPGSYRTFGNNGSVSLNSSINAASSTALAGLANRTTVLDLLTTVSDHLPVVADYFLGSAAENFAPTNINLSSSSVAESVSTGATLGVFSSVDANVGDVHTYSLVAGTGSTDNSRFVLAGNRILIGATASLDGPGSYSVRVRSTDQNGLSFEKSFGIAVTNSVPIVAASGMAISGNEGNTLVNTGTYRDVPSDTVTLIASVGSIVNNGDGTWAWSLATTNDSPSTNVTITAQDEDGGNSNVTFSYTVNNVAPGVTVNNATVEGTVLSSLSNSGTWSDVAADSVTLTSSLGDIVKNANGTWSWSYASPAVVSGQVVTITASDGVSSRSVSFTLTAAAANPSLTITSGNRTYDRSVYSAVASITGSVAPAPSIIFEYYRVAAATTVIPAPSSVGTYYVRAFSAANSNNNPAQSPVTAFTIDPAVLVVSIVANNKPFDNTTAATIASRSLSGVLGPDVVTVSGGTATFPDIGVGNNKLVTGIGLTIGGADASNYIANSTATALANITATVFQRHVFYKGSSFAGANAANPNVPAALDSTKIVAQSGTLAQTLTFANVINTSQGINGLVLDVAGLLGTSLTAADFGFRMSPQGGFVEANHPPSDWISAPAPSVISVTQGTATTPARVRLEWSNNVIQNRWLQVRVLATGNTGLPAQQTFYIGHLQGEVNGLAVGGTSGTLQVTNADVAGVRPSIGTNAMVTSVADINKNGLVQNSDVTEVRNGVGIRQLRLITIPVAGSGQEGTGNGGTGNGATGPGIPFGPRIPTITYRGQSWTYPDDGMLRHDANGLAYYYDGDPTLPASEEEEPLDALALKNQNGGSSSGSGISTSSLTVPAYQSNPMFPKKIYLDFDGQMVVGTNWNNQNYTGSYNTGSVIHAPAYSTDADIANFSASELANIRDIWARVAEDFAPFQVDVTTVDPGDAAFTEGGQAIRVIVSTNRDATSNTDWYPSAGGVAYLNSWYWNDGSPVWVFANRLSNGFAKYVGEAASHEVGHAFNLVHDGRTSPAETYYQGHGANVTGWAPIMGVGYCKNVTQWSKGEYLNASSNQDDINFINTALPYLMDDHGDSAGSATVLSVGSSGNIAALGLITSRADKDVFKFASQSGSISIHVEPFELATGKSNLDLELTLRNDSGVAISTVNCPTLLDGTISMAVPRGYYTLTVDGVGKASAAGDEGYSDYGSIGKYALSGNVQPNRTPTASNDSVVTGKGSSVLIDVLANDLDPDQDPLTIQFLGVPNVGTVSVESGKVRFQPPANFLGTASFSYRIVDFFGVQATGVVTVQVVANVPPTISANASSVSGKEGTLMVNTGVWADADMPANAVTLTASEGVITKNANGTWTWQLLALNQSSVVPVTIAANDGLGGLATISFTYQAMNAPPVLTRSAGQIQGKVLAPFVNSGTWQDVAADTVTLVSSLGVVVKNDNGTWDWSFTPSVAISNQTVLITANDSDGGSSVVSFVVNAVPSVQGGKVFYKGSSFAGANVANPNVPAALDSAKVIAQSGALSQTLTYANVINTSQGINGLVLDVAGLLGTSLTVSDFGFRMSPQGGFVEANDPPSDWISAPVPSVISVTPGTATTPSRVRLEWENNVIQNRWLQIRVLATGNTGLPNQQTFYVGHLQGEVNGLAVGGTSGTLQVTNADIAGVRSSIGTNALVTSVVDIDKNGLVQNSDVTEVRNGIGIRQLRLITIPIAGSGQEGAGNGGAGNGAPGDGGPFELDAFPRLDLQVALGTRLPVPTEGQKQNQKKEQAALESQPHNLLVSQKLSVGKPVDRILMVVEEIAAERGMGLRGKESSDLSVDEIFRSHIHLRAIGLFN